MTEREIMANSTGKAIGDKFWENLRKNTTEGERIVIKELMRLGVVKIQIGHRSIGEAIDNQLKFNALWKVKEIL